MYYIVFGLPIAAVFAAAQVFICIKTKKKAIRLVPLYITAGIILSLGILLLEPVSGALAYYIDWGVLALIVYLTVGAVGSAMGTAIGWLIYYIKCKIQR